MGTDLSDTTRMIRAESLAPPELLMVARHTHSELSADREVPATMFRWMLREAGLTDVFNALERTYGLDAVKDMSEIPLDATLREVSDAAQDAARAGLCT